MLFPQISFRALLGLVAVASVISLITAFAIRGHDWAFATMVGLAVLATTFLLFVLTYTVAFGITMFFGAWRHERATPFSGDAPRQVIPTQDAE